MQQRDFPKSFYLEKRGRSQPQLLWKKKEEEKWKREREREKKSRGFISLRELVREPTYLDQGRCDVIHQQDVNMIVKYNHLSPFSRLSYDSFG